jgi:LytS/YehU family sensor histidine kinase
MRSQPRRAGTSSPLPVHCTVKINLKGIEHTLGHLLQAFLSHTGLVFGRSFVPLFAIAVIAGVMLWGPWVSLAITVVAIILAMGLL